MRALFVATLLVLSALAGCVGRPSESVNDSSNVTAPTQGAPGFLVEGLRVAPGDGRDRPLHEDDTANVRYSLHNAGSGSASYLVSYLLAGSVRDVQTITLAAGATRDFTQDVGSVRGLTGVDVEVKAGDQDAKAHADITPWPRTLDDVNLGGGVSLHVNGWLQNTSTSDVDVNLTIATQPNASAPSAPRARVLCVDARGNVTAAGDATLPVPDVGNWTFATVTLPGCSDTFYGIDLTTTWAYARVLFVERGWRPSSS